MSREHDQASEFEQAERERGEKRIRSTKSLIEATGSCLQCDKPLSKQLRWCNAYCRDDWQAWNPGA
jgi:hypothetical protein